MNSYKSKLYAFISYAHLDNELSDFLLENLINQINAEVSLLIGEKMNVFFDRESIQWGDNWNNVLENGLKEAKLLIPIITPSFFKSKFCQNELMTFVKLENNSSSLILPIYFITADEVESPQNFPDKQWIKFLAEQQYFDLREFRFNRNKNEISKSIYMMGTQIKKLITQIENKNKKPAIMEEKNYSPEEVVDTFKNLSNTQSRICYLFYTNIHPNEIAVDDFYEHFSERVDDIEISNVSELYYRLRDLKHLNLLKLKYSGNRVTMVMGDKVIANILSNNDLIPT